MQVCSLSDLYEYAYSPIILLEHRCHIKGCGYTIVVDGNMKNHHDVCCAGYVEYKGLRKSEKWVSNMPAFKSHYCSLLLQLQQSVMTQV